MFSPNDGSRGKVSFSFHWSHGKKSTNSKCYQNPKRTFNEHLICEILFFFRDHEKTHESTEVAAKFCFHFLASAKLNSFFCSWITDQKNQFLFSLSTSAYNFHFAYQLLKSFLLQLWKKKKKKKSPLCKLPIAKILTEDDKEEPELRIKEKKKRAWSSGYLSEESPRGLPPP